MRYNLYTRADTPNYQVRITLEDGRVIKKSTGCSERGKAEAWVERLIEEMRWRTKLGLQPITQTVAVIWERWVRNDLSERRGYLSAYTKYIQPHWGDRGIDTLKTPEMRSFLKDLPVSPARRAAIGVVMRRIVREAVDRGIITGGAAPVVPSVPYKSGVRTAFSQGEMEQLLAHLKSDMSETGIKVKDRWNRTLLYYYVHLLYNSGCRPGREVEELEWWHFEECLSGNVAYLRVTIRPQNTKTRRERVMLVAAEFMPLYKELIELQKSWGNYRSDGRVFARPDGVVPRFSNEVFRRSLLRSGLRETPDGAARSMYSIRHRVITDWVVEGLPLTAIALQAGNSPSIISSTYSKAVPADFVDKFIR